MNGLPRLLQLGDHLCQFFATADELGEVLVPYFKEGLERNEACIWITSSPYDRQRALGDMRSAADSFEKRHAAGQLRILADDEWYLTNGRLKTDDLVARWLREKDMALAAGYAGLRLSGNIRSQGSRLARIHGLRTRGHRSVSRPAGRGAVQL